MAGTFLSGARNNLGATSRPGVNFPKDVRRRRRTALPIDSQLNNVINQQTQTETDKEIFLAGNQVSNYLNLDTSANLRFAKFETFRRNQNIDPNNIETEWAKLSTAQQDTYLNEAPSNAKTLVKNGKINYKVSKQKYNAVVAQQGISDATTTTTTSSTSSSSGSSGNGGY